MEDSKQLASRFREVMLNGKWIAQTNCKQELANINWQEATQKISSLNTIAALTFHLNYYIDGVLNVLKGGALEIKDKYSFDVPEIKSEADWKVLVQTLIDTSEAFAQQVEHMSTEQLETSFVKAQYGKYRRNIESLIEHGYYHLGQIVLIRKMIKEH